MSLRKILKFKINHDNLKDNSLTKIPKITQKFIKTYLQQIIDQIQMPPTGTELTYKKIFMQTQEQLKLMFVPMTILNNTEMFDIFYRQIKNYLFLDTTFDIRLTIIKTDGIVLYDSIDGFNATQTFFNYNFSNLQYGMETTRADENKWSLLKRQNNDMNYIYCSIWIPNIKIKQSMDGSTYDEEILCFKFGLPCNQEGIPHGVI